VTGRDVCSIREDVHRLVIGRVDGVEGLASAEETSAPIAAVRAATRRGIDRGAGVACWNLASERRGRDDAEATDAGRGSPQPVQKFPDAGFMREH
jgi:hypothetical protein